MHRQVTKSTATDFCSKRLSHLYPKNSNLYLNLFISQLNVIWMFNSLRKVVKTGPCKSDSVSVCWHRGVGLYCDNASIPCFSLWKWTLKNQWQPNQTKANLPVVCSITNCQASNRESEAHHNNMVMWWASHWRSLLLASKNSSVNWSCSLRMYFKHLLVFLVV